MTMLPQRRRRDTDAAKDIKEERRQEAEQPIGGWLLVMNGKHKGEDFRLREGKNIVGSRIGCEVLLTDSYISERHASINVKRSGPTTAQFTIVDLDSTNGTFHNDPGEQIMNAELVDNDVIIFGQTRCKFKCVG